MVIICIFCFAFKILKLGSLSTHYRLLAFVDVLYILVNDEGMTGDSHQLALVQTSPFGQTLTTSEVATGSGMGQGQLTQTSVMTGQALSQSSVDRLRQSPSLIRPSVLMIKKTGTRFSRPTACVGDWKSVELHYINDF